jgi:hypothetical protein
MQLHRTCRPISRSLNKAGQPRLMRLFVQVLYNSLLHVSLTALSDDFEQAYLFAARV